MPYACKHCGGDLKSDGKGLKCICCGSKFASEDELKPQGKKEIILPPPKTEQEAPKQEKGKKQGIFSKFNLGKKKDDSSIKEADPVKPVVQEPSSSLNSVQSEESNDVAAAEQKSNQGVNVFEENQNGVLEITWSDEKYLHSGSGFLVSKRGYAITNTHVVTRESGESCGRVNVRLCGETFVADVIKLGDDKHGHGKGDDLALIKLSALPNNAKVVELEDFDNVKIGEQVFVIGNSLGLGTCITSGIVSDKLRNVGGKMLMMTDCAVNGGNSGGPIFNAQGRVIGAIVSGITEAEGMNFAIPSSTVKAFIASNRPVDYSNVSQKSNDRCPRCQGTNTDVENNIHYCYDCDYEW